MSTIQINSLTELPGTFTNNRISYPAPIEMDQFGEYDIFCFTPVKYVNSNGKDYTWQLIAYLKNGENNQLVKIKPAYYSAKNSYSELNNICGVYVTLYGQVGGKMQQSEPKFVNSGKNIGKTNETNVFTQTLYECVSIYNKYVQKHETSSASIIINGRTIVKDNKFHRTSDGNLIQMSRDNNILMLSRKSPMLLDIYGRVRNSVEIVDENFKRIGLTNKLDKENAQVELYIQPKIDDIRIITHRRNIIAEKIETYSHMDQNIQVELYTRGLIECGSVPNIEQEMRYFYQCEFVKASHYFDGGIYEHGVNLADINSAVRQESGENKQDIKYFLFDLFDGMETTSTLTFSERHELLKKIYADVDAAHGLQYVKLLPTTTITHYREILPTYNQYFNDGYEGIVMRLASSKYVNARSHEVLKLKRLYDAEFKIVGFTAGKGNSSDAIIWILENPENNKRFNCVPVGTMQMRRELYAKLSNDYEFYMETYLNKMMTVQFEEYSQDNIPLRAQALRLHIE